MNDTIDTTLSVDPHWGLMEPGEAARLIGAGDPKEIVNGAQPVGDPDIGD